MSQITVVISTANRKKAELCVAQILASAGMPLQVIVIENYSGRALAHVYNQGQRQALGDICVFVHDDVIIKTKNWAKRILGVFQDILIGMTGVVGSTFMDRTGFWANAGPDFLRGQISQVSNNQVRHHKYHASQLKISEVVAVDGCFFAVKTALFHDGLLFDNELFSGFHFYEVDLAMQIKFKHNKKIVVLNDFWLLHQSEGSFDDHWNKYRLRFLEKYQNKFPIYIDDAFNADYISKQEQSFNKFCKNNFGTI